MKFSDLVSEKDTVEWLPEEISTASLFFAKAESRYGKSRQFNGFVLHQKSPEENEFIQFLEHIRENISEFSGKVRLQVAILTSYIDEFEQKLFLETKRTVPSATSHWTALDIFINHGQIKTFVLDAANSYGHNGIHSRLKEVFPEGVHYIFRADSIPNPKKPGKEKFRTIQSADKGCRIFTIGHLKQLSQIESEKLYAELKQISVQGAIFPKNFVYGFDVNRIFRFTQSWVILSSLPAILLTPIKNHKTVGDWADDHSELNEDGVKQNRGIINKKIKYTENEIKYYNGLTEEMQSVLLEQRTGFTFLQNPILFDIQNEITATSQIDFINLVKALDKNLKKIGKSLTQREQEQINKFLEKIAPLLAQENLPKAKNEFILQLASFFKLIDKSNLQAILKNTLCKSIIQLKINNSTKDLPGIIDLIAKKDTVSPAAKRILISEETKRAKRKLRQDLFLYFGSPAEKTENYKNFSAAYRLAKRKIRAIRVACLTEMYKFRISSVDELFAPPPVKISHDIKRIPSSPRFSFQPSESRSRTSSAALSDSSGGEMSPQPIPEASIKECRELAVKFGISPLQVALTKKLLNAAVFFLAELVEAGSPLTITEANIQDAKGWTLLTHAIRTNQSFKLISALINEYKVDVNLPDNQGKLAIEHALEAELDLDIMKLIITNTEGENVDQALESRLEIYMSTLSDATPAPVALTASYEDLDYSYSP